MGEKPDPSRETVTAGDAAAQGRRIGCIPGHPVRATGSTSDPAGTPGVRPALFVSLVSPVSPPQPLHGAGSTSGSSLGGKGRSICTAAAGGSMHISACPLRPAQPAAPAARRIISSSLLQHRQLNSTAFYLWFPHDASGSAGQQGRDLWRRDKTQLVCTSQTKGLPPEQDVNPVAVQ